tara:strand:+ start:4310 stop:6187 length:1878 start_codon:yes stop_codon:yes gene_type:complete
MARTVDELLIKIKADTKELEKKLKNVKGELKTTGSTGVAAFGGAGLAGALSKIPKVAVGVAAAIGGIGIAVGSVARVGAGFEDLKDSLDTVFGSMEAGDQAMNKVFEFAQTTPFQIEDATKAFIQLKSAGVEPNMEMLQTFADVASTSIDQLGAFEAMVRIVQRSAAGGMGLEEINQLDDRGIPATKILTEALGKSREELSQFGKTAEGAAEMVRILIDGLQEQFGGAMESKMDNLSTKTSNMQIAFKQLADTVFKAGLADFLKGITDRLTAMANASARLIRLISGQATAQDLTGETDPQKQLQALKDLRKEELQRFKDLEKTNLVFLTTGKMGKFEQASHDKKMQELDALITLIRDTMSLSTTTVSDGSTEIAQEFINFMPTIQKRLEGLKTEADLLNAEMAMFNKILANPEVMEALDLTEEKIKSITDAITVQLNEIEEGGDGAGGSIGALNQVVQEAVNAFSTDFVNALMSGQDALKSFKDFAKSLVSQIISTFMQLAVVNQIINAVFAGQIEAGSMTALPTMKLASGGTAQRGRATLVGERGPEIFVPNTGGTVLNNMNSKNAMGGQSVNVYQNLNFATGVVPTVRAEVTKMLPQIAEVTKGAVQESAMRGGSFRRSLIGG